MQHLLHLRKQDPGHLRRDLFHPVEFLLCSANQRPRAVSVNFEEDRLDPIQQGYSNFDDMDPDECDFVPTSGTPSSALLLRSHGFHGNDEAEMSLDTTDLEDSSEPDHVRLWNAVNKMDWEEANFGDVACGGVRSLLYLGHGLLAAA